MSNMFDQYRRELDSLRFSDEALERMTARLKDASLPNVDGGSAATATTNKILELPASRNAQGNVRHPSLQARRPMRWAMRIAASLAIAAGLGLGATGAYAAAAQRSLTAVFSDMFGGAPAQTEVIDNIGHPVGASATSNGVTVTADAVIGSANSCTVVFSISHDDGQPFENLKPADDGTFPLLWASDDIQIDGTQGMGAGAYFYDADPADASIQYVYTVSNATTPDGNGIAGRTARVHLSDLSLATERAADTEVIIKGSWDLKFQLDYEDSSVALPTGQKLSLNGMTVTVVRLSVSPIGASITYTVDETSTELTPENQRSGTLPSDKYVHLPFTVTFTDGRTEDGTDADASTSEHSGRTTVTKSFVFDTITDVDNIASITVGDQVIPVR